MSFGVLEHMGVRSGALLDVVVAMARVVPYHAFMDDKSIDSMTSVVTTPTLGQDNYVGF